MREVKEETGLKILKIKKMNVYGSYEYERELKDRKGIIGQEFSLYCVEVKEGKINIDKKEHEYYKWCDYKEAIKKLTWENQKQCLIIVNNYLKKR